MINIAYCSQCNPKKVVAAGIIKSAMHRHDNTDYATTIIEADEHNYSGETGFKTKDGTTINSSDEWLSYLSKYIP